MDIKILFNITTLVIFSSFIFSLIIKAWKKPKYYEKLPPGPPKLPVIGNLHHLVGAGGLLYDTLSRLAQKYGPDVLHLQLGQVSAVVISSPQAAKQVLKDQDPGCAGRPESICTKIIWYDFTDIAFSPYNEYWRQMRKICILELLSAKNVKSFGFIRAEEVSRMIESIRAAAETVDLTEKVFGMTSAITCRAAFGDVLKDQEALIYLLKKGITLAGRIELADLFPSLKVLQILSWNRFKLMRMRRKIDSILDVVVEKHKLKQSNKFAGDVDLVDVLIRMQRNGELRVPITNDNIKAVIFDVFSAGTDTSSTTINWAMAELMRNPRVMEKVQREVREALKGKTTVAESDVQGLKYLKLVVKETFRLHPPIPLLPRACREEGVKVNGYSIPINSKVMVNIWSMGRDPQYWDKPESFEPERFENSTVDFQGNNFEYLPFGAGRRICPGMNFGLVNTELPLAQLLYHFDWSLPEGMTRGDVDMTEEEGIIVSKKKPLLLVPTVYNHPSN
ncbi:hypothetical protein ACP275_01G032900 [Erythranthe tilingii]